MRKSQYVHRRIFLVPATKRERANAALERLGYGPDNFSVPLQNAQGRVVFYACDLRLTSADLGRLRKLAVGVSAREEEIALGHSMALRLVARKYGLRRKEAEQVVRV